MDAQATSAGPGWVRLDGEDLVPANHIVNAAGLYADVVARWFGVGQEYRMLPFKGLYWHGSWEPNRLQRHVYPVPDSKSPFLGVHLTVTVDGRAKIGPTAIPVLWREEYGGLSGFRASEVGQVLATFPRVLGSPHHDVIGLIRTEVPKYRRTEVIRQARALVPSTREVDFTVKGRPGVRAQLFHMPTKRLEMDFVVRPGERSTHILNAVSPAWTSALAFAEYVVAGIPHD